MPADFDRVQRQIEVVSPLVDKVLCYQYLGMMNKENSPVFAGHETSAGLYREYMNYLQMRGLGSFKSDPNQRT
ncbi:hypothetical protein D3C76_1420980 [compost metagenome]